MASFDISKVWKDTKNKKPLKIRGKTPIAETTRAITKYNMDVPSKRVFRILKEPSKAPHSVAYNKYILFCQPTVMVQ